jgi:hypothetical protein
MQRRHRQACLVGRQTGSAASTDSGCLRRQRLLRRDAQQHLQRRRGLGGAEARAKPAASRPHTCSSLGLAALAGRPCRHSLRSVKIDLYAGSAAPQLLPTPAQAAPLLLPGALPQLRELQLPIVVCAGSLLQGGSGAGRARRRASHEAPPGGPGQYLQRCW